MTLKVKRGGVFVDPVQGQARKTNGIQTKLGTIYRRQGGTWVLAWSAYTPVSGYASPTSVSGGAQGAPASGNVTTNYTAAYGQNGNGSYSYTWSIVSVSNGAAPIITTPNAQSTSFSRTVAASIGSITAVAACTISDGQSSYVVYVNITLSYSQNK